jgi:D-alanyl-lipoteichoic acid acyltransferase DltB (MBOAT superfamily)
MRPFRSFLLLLVFLICFAGLYYILPWKLNLPKVEDLVPKELISDLAGKQPDIIPDPDSLQNIRHKTPALLNNQDSLLPVALNPEIKPDSVNTYPLGSFTDSLRSSKGQVRIMYYGDSQIEGDRITSYLRREMRKDGRGGTGPGLFLPVMPVTYTKSFYVRASSNWGRFNYLSYRNREISHRKLGPCMAYCRYLPEGRTAQAGTRAWIKVVPSVLTDSSTLEYDVLRILYTNKKEPVRIVVRTDNLPDQTDSLEITEELKEFKCQLGKSGTLYIEFSGKGSPDIYGISIESLTGVVIDNIPQRGSAGLEFTMVDSVNLKESFQLLKPDLIILHFGLNIVKNLSESYTYYEKGLSRQLALLRRVCPAGTRFVLVGLTDMAYSEGAGIKSFPNLQMIMNAQKNAAKQTNTVFWDAYKAMGGKSSILKWFSMDPPLAKKDYIHFTDQGADTLARRMMADLFVLPPEKQPPVVTSNIIKDSVSTANLAERADTTGTSGNSGFLRSFSAWALKYDQGNPFIFTSPAFWIFFLIVLLVYSLVYRKLTLRNLYLFLVSLFFYYKTGGLFLFILIFVTVVDYACGILIYRAEKKAVRKLFVIISIVSNLGLLGYFKYTGFIVNSINSLLHTNLKVVDLLSSFSNSILGTSFDLSYIILPVGISFFTFQSLSYTIDVYRKKMEPVRNIIDFGFYVSFFPHLVAGPIVRASVFIPQIYQDFRVTPREFSHALYMISKGLIKKIIISNFIAVNFIDRVFDMPSVYSGFENLLAIYGYGLQIYCDFSGYTDIAIGVALILGFRLPVNFNSPYKATNISDFWKRWHISLSQWLRDYLYISLGGNRKGRFRTCINLMITMLLGGLWHGANIRFILWGGLHGLGLVVNKIWTWIFGGSGYRKGFLKVLSVFVTFQFVSFCWIFFRAPDIQSAGLMLHQIFTSFVPSSFSDLFRIYSGVFSLMAAGYLIHFLPEKLKESYRGLFIRIPLAGQVVIIMLVAIMLFQMRTSEILPFIYFRF